MIRSMTGYGKAEEFYAGKKILIEVKSLNSKQLDLNIKTPQELRAYELDIRDLVSNKLQRGKIDVMVTLSNTNVASEDVIDEKVIESYVRQVREISNNIGIEQPADMAALVFKMPGIFNVAEQVYDEAFEEKLLSAASRAIDIVDGFRVQEGAVLKNDLLKRVQLILNYLAQVEPLESARHTNIKERLTKNLNDLLTNNQYDENRFEQELIFYLEKLDITEEKVRLRQHCNYFNTSIDEELAGKKLGFISQEMGREINTLGSKANEANIQRLVVMMKDELEKIKEQLFNIL